MPVSVKSSSFKFCICVSVSKETDFELSGFIIVMLAAVMSGFRWTMTQILLQVCSPYICQVASDIKSSQLLLYNRRSLCFFST